MWERGKNPGSETNIRTGATMASAGTRAFSFGGVEDRETDEAVVGQFFDKLYIVPLDAKPVWHQVTS